MAEVLNVQIRATRGKRNARRLRATGATPAVLYGHGRETISLTVPTDELDALVRHGGRVVTLAGAVSERALVRELQWDTWGTHVLHVDLARVFEHEKVEVEVPLELRGEAPGVKEGGVVEHLVHQVRLQCEATLIPDKLHVNINHLNLDESIAMGDLELPERAALLEDPESIVVQCVAPAAEAAEEAVEAEGAEPEVIGRKEEEGEEEKEKK
jgi:large subunit ribosomal protein L25